MRMPIILLSRTVFGMFVKTTHLIDQVSDHSLFLCSSRFYIRLEKSFPLTNGIVSSAKPSGFSAFVKIFK